MLLTFQQKPLYFFMRLIVILLSFLSVFSFLLIGFARLPLGVGVLFRYYHKTFYQIGMNAENVRWTVDVVAKLCLVVTPVIGKNYIHFTFKYIYILL